MADLTADQLVKLSELMKQLDEINAATPAEYDPPNFLGNYRHKCAAQRNTSKPIELKEIYLEDPDGEVALIYREGNCKKCGQVARSVVGRPVLMSERPPISGRVSRA